MNWNFISNDPRDHPETSNYRKTNSNLSVFPLDININMRTSKYILRDFWVLFYRFIILRTESSSLSDLKGQ